MDFLQTEIAANSVQTWLIASVIIVTVILVAGIFRYVSVKHLKRVVEQSDVTLWAVLLTAVRQTRWLFIFILALFVGSLVMEMPATTTPMVVWGSNPLP